MGSKKKKKALKKQQEATSKQPTSKQLNKKSWSNYWPALTLILIFTFLCYSPNLNNGFVNWDDGENIYENDLITQLNNQNFWELSKEIFQTDIIGGYNPLTNWTFLLEKKFIGLDNPEYWHLNNIILHLISCMFVFWIGRRMRLGLLGCSILTLLFAIHPMRVESVAWITERKDVLFGAFYLAALYYYIKGKQDGFRKRDHLIIAVCFSLSLFSKIQAVMLPVSMVLVDYYLSDDLKLKLQSIITKWPYFLGSLVIGVLGIYLLADEGSTDLMYSGISRFFIGAYSLSVYYIKSIIPYRLSPLYPYPAFLDWKFYASTITFIATGYLLWQSYTRKWKVIFFGLSFFLANVVMLLQILGAGQGFLADRFTYIPYIGLFFIYAYFIERTYKSKAKFRAAILMASALIIVAYAYQCFQQNKIWKDSDTLWTHVLKYYKNSDTPWANRAIHYRDNDMFEKALYDYTQYINLVPEDPDAYNSKARLYFNFTERDSLLKSLENFDKAISLKANDPEYHVNRGSTYAKLGEKEKALADFNLAAELDPDYPNAFQNRSLIYNGMQEWELALKDISRYLELMPYDAKMWIEKARLHMILQDYNPWLEASDKAISMEPNNGLFFYERARGFHYMEKPAEAKTSLQKALKLGYNRGNKNLIDKILNYD